MVLGEAAGQFHAGAVAGGTMPFHQKLIDSTRHRVLRKAWPKTPNSHHEYNNRVPKKVTSR
jgi:hypothetical protein